MFERKYGLGKVVAKLDWIKVLVGEIRIGPSFGQRFGSPESKRSLGRKEFLLQIYLYLPSFITQRVHGRFYRLDIKILKNGHLGKLAIDKLDSSMMKKMTTDSKSKETKHRHT